MPRRPQPREILENDLKTKEVYSFIDQLRRIHIRSREVYKNINKVVHFPFNRYDGQQKYNNIRKIVYENMPKNLPAGILKSFRTGYGFSRDLSTLIYAIQDKFPEVTQLKVMPEGETGKISDTEFLFSYKDLEKYRPQINALLKKHKSEKNTITQNILADILPDHFDKKEIEYEKGELKNFISLHSLTASKLSIDDFEGLSDLLSDLPANHEFIKTQKILVTKRSIDKIYIEEMVKKYNILLSQRTDTQTLEDRWQSFFKENILYFNFGYVQKFEKEIIKGDKSINIPDFILLNTYGYLDVFEIKTHLTQLLSYDTGRKNFYWSSAACKAISQAENYIDSITKEEDTIIKNIRDEYNIHHVDAVRPVVYIIASSKDRVAGENTIARYVGKINKKLKNDFRRLSNSLKNVNFILYDELLEVFKNTLDRLTEDKNA